MESQPYLPRCLRRSRSSVAHPGINVISALNIQNLESHYERLAAGKVYPAERFEPALENFFTDENLTRLREFALEEIAHRLGPSTALAAFCYPQSACHP